MNKNEREQYRFFLKDSVRLMINFHQTDQHRGIRPPALEKPLTEDSKLIDLPPADTIKNIPAYDLISAIANRRSHRTFKDAPLRLDELSFLLWATQGIRRKVDDTTAYRTVPSAGCRHSFETYISVLNITGIEQGIYRYLPIEHQLVFEHKEENLGDRLVEAALGQPFFGKAAASFIWTPFLTAWSGDMTWQPIKS